MHHAGTQALREYRLRTHCCPNHNQLALGSLGSIDTSIHFEGSPSITAVPWQGRDAIQMATPVLQTVADWPSGMVEHKGFTSTKVSVSP